MEERVYSLRPVARTLIMQEGDLTKFMLEGIKDVVSSFGLQTLTPATYESVMTVLENALDQGTQVLGPPTGEEQYVATGGSKCPSCGDPHHLTYSDLVVDESNDVVRIVTCTECLVTYKENLTPTSIAMVTEEEVVDNGEA